MLSVACPALEPEDQPWGRYVLFRHSHTDPAEGHN